MDMKECMERERESTKRTSYSQCRREREKRREGERVTNYVLIFSYALSKYIKQSMREKHTRLSKYFSLGKKRYQKEPKCYNENTQHVFHYAVCRHLQNGAARPWRNDVQDIDNNQNLNGR